MRLSVPREGLRARGILLRLPTLDDVDGILPAFTDPELREAGNLPAFGRKELIASLRELPLLAGRSPTRRCERRAYELDAELVRQTCSPRLPRLLLSLRSTS
jgi:hypothetical protein